MPNLCEYEMQIKGNKNAVRRVIDCLKANYDYENEKPSHKHFFRVFEANVDFENDEENGIVTAFVWGNCAWSVSSCMIKDGYYNDCKKKYPDTFMGTDLEEQSEDCEIEVFSEEIGYLFSEHYIYKNGVCECNDCVDIDVEDDNDEYIVNNPHRIAPNDVFDWTI